MLFSKQFPARAPRNGAVELTVSSTVGPDLAGRRAPRNPRGTSSTQGPNRDHCHSRRHSPLGALARGRRRHGRGRDHLVGGERMPRGVPALDRGRRRARGTCTPPERAAVPPALPDGAARGARAGVAGRRTGARRTPPAPRCTFLGPRCVLSHTRPHEHPRRAQTSARLNQTPASATTLSAAHRAAPDFRQRARMFGRGNENTPRDRAQRRVGAHIGTYVSAPFA